MTSLVVPAKSSSGLRCCVVVARATKRVPWRNGLFNVPTYCDQRATVERITERGLPRISLCEKHNARIQARQTAYRMLNAIPDLIQSE